jgi:hypothetical protein
VVPYLMAWLAKPSLVLDGRSLVVAVHTTAPERDFGLDITDTVTMVDTPADPDATLVLPTESWLRLASGRLGAAVTPDGVTVTGPLTLDDLRRLFPGF